MDLGEELKILGWRQGSLLTDSDLRALIPAAPTPFEPTAIVLSHSCDLLNGDLIKVPKVEIILGKSLGAPDSRCERRRNPRVLHLAYQVNDSEQWLEIKVENRLFIDRGKLSGRKPDSSRRLLQQDCRDLGLWISGAYYRSALPDSFQNCIFTNRKEFDRIYRKLAKHVSDILISIYPDRELLAGEQYSATATLLIEQEKNTTDPEVLACQTELETVLKKSGIDSQVTISAETKAPIALLKSSYRLTTDSWSDLDKGDPITPLAEKTRH